MNLLNQFGLKPITRSSTSRGGKPQVGLSVGLTQSGQNYTLNISEIVKKHNLNWHSIDIAFSKEHGGMFIAKGDTFALNKDGKRANGRDIYEQAWKFFGLQRPKIKAKVIFTFETFSEDIFLLKLSKVAYII